MARLLSFDQAIFVSRTLLEAQGFGTGGDVKSSGEAAVFSLVNGSAPVLFDVGGHLGEYTDAFLRVHPGGRAFVFEPSVHHFLVLKKRFGNRDNVTLIGRGLSSQSGEFPLYKDCRNFRASLADKETPRPFQHYDGPNRGR